MQLPLPSHMNETTILDAVDISKDVDGFHPLNIGCLAMRGREPRYVSCTPKGCMELLKRNNIELSVRGTPLDMTSMSAACACACFTCACHPGVNHVMSVHAALTTWAVYHQVLTHRCTGEQHNPPQSRDSCVVMLPDLHCSSKVFCAFVWTVQYVHVCRASEHVSLAEATSSACQWHFCCRMQMPP